MMTSLLLTVWPNTPLFSQITLWNPNTPFLPSGPLPCTTVAPQRSCGTPPPVSTAVSLTSSQDVTPQVSSTQRPATIFMMSGTARNSSSTASRCSMV